MSEFIEIILNNLIELIPDDNFKNLKNYLSSEVLQSLEIKMSQI